MAACPYNVRYVDPIKKIVQKCTWCYRRVDAGDLPACAKTCIGGARIFGDINDPDSEIFRLISTNPVQVIKPEKGTSPMVFYIDLDITAVEARENI